MPATAAASYGARLRVAGRLPRWALVPLVFVRNVVLGAFGLGTDDVAPAVVEVLRLSDGAVVGRIEATSSYYEQARVLAEVRRGLQTQSSGEFLQRWGIDLSQVG